MGLPKDNSQGYHDGSPIDFAEGLRGKLLIVHGSGDDNCHFKVTELLVNRLIALDKSFDLWTIPIALMPFPRERAHRFIFILCSRAILKSTSLPAAFRDDSG